MSKVEKCLFEPTVDRYAPTSYYVLRNVSTIIMAHPWSTKFIDKSSEVGARAVNFSLAIDHAYGEFDKIHMVLGVFKSPQQITRSLVLSKDDRRGVTPFYRVVQTISPKVSQEYQELLDLIRKESEPGAKKPCIDVNGNMIKLFRVGENGVVSKMVDAWQETQVSSNQAYGILERSHFDFWALDRLGGKPSLDDALKTHPHRKIIKKLYNVWEDDK